MNLRRATIRDVSLLIKLRMDFLNTYTGQLSDGEIRAIQPQLSDYYIKHIPLGDFIAVIVEIDENVAATAFMTIEERPANTSYITGKTAMIHNVLTYPDYRRRGISSRILSELIREAKNADVSAIDLLAAEDAMPLYQKFGFTQPKNTYMRLKLNLADIGENTNEF